MKKIVAMLIACMLIVSACAFAETEITVWTPAINAAGYMQDIAAMTERFEAANEGINVEIVELNWDGIGEKLETAMMTDSTPDVYIDGTARTAKLPSTGLTVDVSDVLAGLDGWNEGAVAIGEVDGGHYLVPMTLMPSTILTINTSLAKEYGVYDMLPEDHMSWDWTEFIAFLEACGEKSLADGVYPIGIFAGSQSSDIAYYTMLLSAGAAILNEDHSAAAVNSSEAVQAMAYLKEIVDKGLAYPGVAEITDDNAQGVFLAGKTVVDLSINGGLNAIPLLEAMVADGLLSEVPEVEGYAWPTLNGSATNIGNWGANCIAIFENEGDEEKIAAAKAYISFMMNDKEYLESLWADAASYGPARDMGLELKLDNERMLKEAEINATFAAYNNSAFGVLESYWGEIRQYFYPELQSMLLGNKTPEEAIAAFEKGITEVLNFN